ncbi:zinc-finger-containing protein [Culicoidibacter larvae]|uniref:Uncharacterized protein n=1 Tax=Culicoidibacter larvae TaxID=2579976 RepID=A0A5R8Q9U6_9FIRM|nr:zinc-finger-containing protein [Culicoidibacter larvae]TLG71393.1 hypothetical protein FEZ08_10895 [Culicoidibacter larvae]
METQKFRLICPYCGSEAKLLSSKEFYGTDYGTNVYSCPDCDAYVGTHGRGGRPLGTLANQQLRILRRKCHKEFDKLWQKRGGWTRGGAYQWLADTMGLTAEEAHIGMFSVEQCQLLLAKLEFGGLR